MIYTYKIVIVRGFPKMRGWMSSHDENGRIFCWKQCAVVDRSISSASHNGQLLCFMKLIIKLSLSVN